MGGVAGAAGGGILGGLAGGTLGGVGLSFVVPGVGTIAGFGGGAAVAHRQEPTLGVGLESVLALVTGLTIATRKMLAMKP